MHVSSEVVWQLGPEILVVVTAVCVYVGGAFAAPRASWSRVGLAGLGLAGGYLSITAPLASAEPLLIDSLAVWTRWLALGLGVILVLLSWRPSGDPDGAWERLMAPSSGASRLIRAKMVVTTWGSLEAGALKDDMVASFLCFA